MHTPASDRTAFRKVADISSHGRVGTVVVLCPKCHTRFREYTTQVNGFNEWSFRTSYEGGRTVYTSVDYDGRGCCF